MSTNHKALRLKSFRPRFLIIYYFYQANECKAEANTGIPVRDSSNVFASASQCILRGTSIIVASSIMSLVSFTIKLILCQQDNLN